MKQKFFILILIAFSISALSFSPAMVPGGKDKGKSEGIGSFAGNWIGHGAGEEVRFRHKLGLLTLTVKHKTEFVFSVGKDGKIEGDGTIEYDLDNNTSGLDDLVASVHSLMGLAKVPGTGSAIADKMGEKVRDVKGVTKIQYDAPHLKNGPEIRHFKFTGMVEQGPLKDRYGRVSKRYAIRLDEVKEFTLPDGKPDNTLIAQYEVNRVKTDAKFPCWSPFIIGAGVIREGPGNILIAEFQKKGKHRKGKQVWQEYGYVWMARRISEK